MVRHGQALPQRFMERRRHQCLRVHQAAVPAQEAQQESEGAPVHWWLDVLVEFCPTGEY